MPNIFEILRMANIFNPMTMGNDMPSQGGISGNMPQQGGFPGIRPSTPSIFEPTVSTSNPMETITVEGMSPSEAVSGRMKDLYSPETSASDRFNELLGKFPQYNQYRPSMLRRIGAAISTFGEGGSEAGHEFLNRPYTQQLSDWKNVIGPAQSAANLERQTNANERQMAYQTISQELRAEADEARNQRDMRKLDIAEKRAQIYEFKAKNPNVKFDFSGPTVLIADPATGRLENTGVPTGHMTDMDKIGLNQEMALGRIEATGAQTRRTEGVRQEGRETIAETRGWRLGVDNETGKSILYNEITGETKPVQGGKDVKPISRTTATTRPELPTQTKVRQYNAAKQLANSNPELAKFIKFGPGTNEFSITPPSEGGYFTKAGPTVEQHAQLQQQIYGGDIPISQPGRSGATPATTPTGKSPSANDAKRNQAIELLKKNKKPVTENNITFVMKQLQ